MAFDSNKAILPITFTNNYGIIGALYGEKLRVAPGKTKAIISAPLYPSDFRFLTPKHIDSIHLILMIAKH